MAISRRSIVRVEDRGEGLVTIHMPRSLAPAWMKDGLSTGVLLMDSGEVVLVPTLKRAVQRDFRLVRGPEQ